MGKEKVAKKPTVRSYFTKIGVKTAKSYKKFWENIKLNHGTEIHDHLIYLLEARGKLYEETGNMDSLKLENIYEVKNQNLKLSLDFSHLTADFNRKFLEYFVGFAPAVQPNRILEIGCDNGITTCFLALQFPQAEVIGIDISQNGINSAKELAQQLNISNVHFISTDFYTFFQQNQEEPFDLILSLRVMHEIIGYFPEFKSFSTKDYIEQLDVEENEVITALQKLLNEKGGLYISCERLPHVESYGYWSKLLNKSGLYIDWSKANYNRFTDVDQGQVMTIFIASKQNNNQSTYDELVNFSWQGAVKDIDIYTTVMGINAEYLMQVISPKTLLNGIQINWMDGSGKFRIEIWEEGEHLYIYKYSNLGYKVLEKRPLEELELVLDEIEEFITMNTSFAYTESFSYKTLEECEKIDREFI